MKFFLIFFAVIVFVNLEVQAKTYFVTEPVVPAPDRQSLSSLKSLIESAVTNAHGDLATTSDSADYTLSTQVVRLGQALIVTVTRAQIGKVLNTSRQKANTIEELDDVTDKAVRAAMLDVNSKKDMRVGEVRERDENTLKRRIQSHNTTYLGFGPSSFANMGVSGTAYDLGIGYNWEVTPQACIRVLAQQVVSANWKTEITSGELGLNYYLSDEDMAPYVGAGLGYGVSGSTESSATTVGGFAGSLNAGLLLFRTSSTHFDINLSYTTLFADNTLGHPGVGALRIGVLY